MKEPRFKIGDAVYHKPDLFGRRRSTVVYIERYFCNGHLELATRESDIKNMRSELNARIEDINGVPHFIHDGDSSVDLRPAKSPVAGWMITTTNADMSTIWNEKSLRRMP